MKPRIAIFALAACVALGCGDIRSAVDTPHPPPVVISPTPQLTLEERDFELPYPYDEVEGLRFRSSLNPLNKGEKRYELTLDWYGGHIGANHPWGIYLRRGDVSTLHAHKWFQTWGMNPEDLPYVIELTPPLPDSIDIRLYSMSCETSFAECPLIKRITIR